MARKREVEVTKSIRAKKDVVTNEASRVTHGECWEPKVCAKANRGLKAGLSMEYSSPPQR